MEEPRAAAQDAMDFFDNLTDMTQIEGALERLQQCDVSANVGVCYRVALALQKLGRIEDAIAKYQEVKRLALAQGRVGAEICACIEQGILLRGINNEASRRELERGISLAEDNSEALPDIYVQKAKYELGKLLYLIENYENAIGYLEAGFGLQHLHQAAVHYFLGVSHLRIKAFDKAMKHLQACTEMDPEILDAFGYLTDVYLALQNYKKAVEVAAQGAEFARKVDNCFLQSYFLWIAGCVETRDLGEHKQASLYLTSSLNAAFKIQDPQKQAKRLLDAGTWLNKSLHSLNGIIEEKFYENAQVVTEEVQSQISLGIIRAEAYGYLGRAMFKNGSLDEACKCFQNAIHLLPQEQACSDWERGLLFNSQWSLAKSYIAIDEDEKALEVFKQCKLIAPSAKYRLECDIDSCFAIKRLGHYRRAAARFSELLVENGTLLDSEPDLKAQLLVGIGQSFLFFGNKQKAILNLEAARKLWEDRSAFDSSWLAVTYALLFEAYIQNQQFSVAFELASSCQGVLSQYHRGSQDEQFWHMVSGSASSMLGDNELAVETLTKQHDSQEKPDWTTLASLANAHRNRGDLDGALALYDEAINLLPVSRDVFVAHLYVNRAAAYMHKATSALLSDQQSESSEYNTKALDEYQQAIQIFEGIEGGDRRDLANAYAGQAVVLYHSHDFNGAASKLETAVALAGSDQLLIAKLKRIRASLLAAEGAIARAISEAREAALIFAELQMRLQDLESAWVTLLGRDMKHIISHLQRLLVHDKRCLEALLWAERGRMRLYFYLMGRQSPREVARLESCTSLETTHQTLPPLWFDNDDGLAINCIREALQGCAPGSVVIEYTYAAADSRLYIYVVRLASELTVDIELVNLKDFFARKQNSRLGRTLDALVKRTRTEIQRIKANDKAKLGMSILHALLVQPVWKLVQGCSTIIFAPHEILSLVPFAALYDEVQGKYLIEEKVVGTVPSFRALHHCLLRQAELDQQTTMKPRAFVAGDPQPMGLGLPQLKGAAEEAAKVATQLGVDPVVGSRMTKKATVEGLSNASIVLLVTHGIVSDAYPHGALIMQGQGKVSCNTLESLAVQSRLGTRAAHQSTLRAAEVLTAKEIEKLDGGIRAGLVVMSACQTGEGVVSSEGLLGLGRAVLQAGASCAVLTLWKVDDDTTKDLVTGMFQELVQSHNILDSLRSAMLTMLNSGLPIYNWASLVALGSPTLKLDSIFHKSCSLISPEQSK